MAASSDASHSNRMRSGQAPHPLGPSLRLTQLFAQTLFNCIFGPAVRSTLLPPLRFAAAAVHVGSAQRCRCPVQEFLFSGRGELL